MIGIELHNVVATCACVVSYRSRVNVIGEKCWFGERIWLNGHGYPSSSNAA
jgi:hypothetical protein